ncbi:hypothetical protein K1719_036318 [Acacia pycnantha]|nr:hypothetical protein K1719_036318 [Acacia pycnantha]
MEAVYLKTKCPAHAVCTIIFHEMQTFSIEVQQETAKIEGYRRLSYLKGRALINYFVRSIIYGLLIELMLAAIRRFVVLGTLMLYRDRRNAEAKIVAKDIQRGPKVAGVQARSVLCSLSEGDVNAITELNS